MPRSEPIAAAASSSSSVNLLAIYARGNQPVSAELDATLTIVEGELPPDLVGTHYRNGPGKQEAFGVPYDHPFDGDGMVTRFAFDGQHVHYRNRFVRTREFVEEERAQRMLYRGFGTNLPGGILANGLRARFKNAANTSLVHHGGRLLALWEGGLPHALDPETLATLGRFDFDGALRPDSALDRLIMPELPFSAHPTIDPDTGDLINFGTAYGREPRLMYYRVDAAGVMREVRSIPLERMSFVHDFVLTPRYAVFALTPVVFDIPRALAGLATPVASLSHDEREPTVILLVPRDGGAPRSFLAPGGFIFHYVNGFEEDDHTVVLDGCWMPTLPGAQVARAAMRGEAAPFEAATLTRITLDLRRGVVSRRVWPDTTLELPTIHPAHTMRRHRWAFGVSQIASGRSSLSTALSCVDCQTGEALQRDFAPDLPGEPLFVPRPNSRDERDGWLLSLVYRSALHVSDLLILDARTLKTCAAARLPHHVPHGFHSIFV